MHRFTGATSSFTRRKKCQHIEGWVCFKVEQDEKEFVLRCFEVTPLAASHFPFTVGFALPNAIQLLLKGNHSLIKLVRAYAGEEAFMARLFVCSFDICMYPVSHDWAIWEQV